MQTEQRQHRGYVLEGKLYNGEWQVHVYHDDKGVPPFPPDLSAVRNINKDLAFAKAEQRIDDYLHYWAWKMGESPLLRARR